jgi:hypothetical protein
LHCALHVDSRSRPDSWWSGLTPCTLLHMALEVISSSFVCPDRVLSTNQHLSAATVSFQQSPHCSSAMPRTGPAQGSDFSDRQ